MNAVIEKLWVQWASGGRLFKAGPVRAGCSRNLLVKFRISSSKVSFWATFFSVEHPHIETSLISFSKMAFLCL